MKISILNYGACNIRSVFYAFKNLGIEPKIITDSKDIKNSDKLIIPGVGSAGSSLSYLRSNNMYDGVINFIESEKPILGICLGLQIFSKKLYEDGVSDGFSVLDADVVKFKSKKYKFHIGWNEININKKYQDFFKIKDQSIFYFCHSYFLNFKKSCDSVVATSNFKISFPSIVINKNFMGVQFHPEKSQANGIKIIDKFLNWRP